MTHFYISDFRGILMNSRKRKGQLESMIGKIFVLSLFLILLVNLIVPNKEKSEEENRMLETKPKASAASIISGDYMEQWEKYVSDQFFGRNLEEDKSKRR